MLLARAPLEAAALDPRREFPPPVLLERLPDQRCRTRDRMRQVETAGTDDSIGAVVLVMFV